MLRPAWTRTRPCRDDRSDVGPVSRLAYMRVVALSRLGEPESRHRLYFAVGSAVAGGVAMLFTGMSDWPGWQRCIAAHRRAGGRRAAVHDARPCQRQDPVRHAGGVSRGIQASCLRASTAWPCLVTRFRPSAGSALVLIVGGGIGHHLAGRPHPAHRPKNTGTDTKNPCARWRGPADRDGHNGGLPSYRLLCTLPMTPTTTLISPPACKPSSPAVRG